MAESIRVFLIDDHELFREGLARLLQHEPDIKVVGQSASIDAALALFSSRHVDVVLLDYDLGDEIGTDLLEITANLRPAPRVVIVTAGMAQKKAQEALQKGAVAIVAKHSGPVHLIGAIRSAHDHSLRPQSEKALLTVPSRYPASSTSHLHRRPLTTRQSSVLRGVLEGFSSKEIAVQTNLSEGSVKAVLQELFRKTGARTRAQLVRFAIEQRLTSMK